MNIKCVATSSFTFGGNEGHLVPDGYSGIWHENEIREIPRRLFDELIANKKPITADAATVALVDDHRQNRFKILYENELAEAEAKTTAARAKFEEMQIQEKVNLYLAQEQAQKIAKLRAKAKKELGL